LRYLVLTPPAFEIAGYNTFLSGLTQQSFSSSGDKNLYTEFQYGGCVDNALVGIQAHSNLVTQGWRFDDTRLACAPTVTFSPNGNTAAKNTHSTTVTVNNSGGIMIETSSLKYLWTTGSTAPTETELLSGQTFTGGSLISKNDGD
jgi:hypothetical protein